MLQYDFEESVGYWITLGAQAFQKALNDELLPHGITFRQSQVLGWLVLEGELSQVELANRMTIEPPTLVGILDRMERDGWISREPCVGDRRKKIIRIRPEAAATWAKIVQCARRVRSRATRGLSAQQQRTLRRLLRHVNQNLGSPASALASHPN
jgi:MarR family transcriptional regulator for hemolysin